MFHRRTDQPGSARGDLRLRILATTDLHCHILPYDYFADRPCDRRGLARIEALLRELRRDGEGVLLLDGGDFLTGNPMADYLAETEADAAHPMIEAMNLLGFDAAALGNHDFDHGVSYLGQALRRARFPVLSANILRARGPSPLQDEHLLRPGCILHRHLRDGDGNPCELRIGLIGFAPPRSTALDGHLSDNSIKARDMVEAARIHVPELRRGGADIVIALAHSGPGLPEAEAELRENASLMLAGVDGVDAVIGGHTHQIFPGPDFAQWPGTDCARATFAGKPAMMSGAYGSHLGCMDLVLRRSKGRTRVVGHSVALHPVATAPAPEPRQGLAARFAGVHDATLGYIRREVGSCETPITTHFSMVGTCPAARLICAAKRDYVTRALEGRPEADLPVLATAAPFRAGGRGGPRNYVDIPPGPILLRHLAEVYPYPNTIRALRVTGAQLRDWLELSAVVFRQLTPGAQDQMLLDPEVPSYNFDLIDGPTYEIDPSQPARFFADGRLADASAQRIRNLRWRGRPLDDDAQFVLATSSYRVTGAKGPWGTPEVVLAANEPIRALIREHLGRAGPFSAPHQPVWRFAPLPKTSALFDTAPDALLRGPAPAGLVMRPTGTRVEGFERLRLLL